MARQRLPGRVRVAAVVVIADDVTILPFLERALGLLLDKPVAETRTMHHTLGRRVLNDRVAGGIADYRQVVIVRFHGFVRRTARDELPVVIAIHVKREAELAHAV